MYECKDLYGANEFNIFILNNYSAEFTDSQGKVAVGGNILLNDYSVASHLPKEDSPYLIVGGKIDIESGSNNGTTIISNSKNVIHYTMTNYNGSVIAPTEDKPIDFSSVSSYLKCYSNFLGKYSTNSSYNLNSGGQLTITGKDSDMNIVTLPSNILSTANEIILLFPQNSTLIINVTGDFIHFPSAATIVDNNNPPTADEIEHILWNFPDATKFTASGVQIDGTVLAPNANSYLDNGNLQGTIISYNLTGGMEFHNYPFNGNLPQNSNCCFNTDTTPTSPNTPSSTNAPVFCAKPCKVCIKGTIYCCEYPCRTSHIKVYLFNSICASNPLEYTLTNSKGEYEFSNIDAGEYVVAVYSTSQNKCVYCRKNNSCSCFLCIHNCTLTVNGYI